MATGLLAFGLVLGWAAVFLHGSSPIALLVRSAWLTGLLVFVLLSPEPAYAFAGVTIGLFGHLLWQAWLKERRA